MDANYFKHAVEEMERHFKSSFGTRETRVKLLNNVWASVRQLDDADLTLAAELLMMTCRALPTPADLQRAIEAEAKKRGYKLTDDLEREAEQYRREAQRRDNILLNQRGSQFVIAMCRLGRQRMGGDMTTSEFAAMMADMESKHPGLEGQDGRMDYGAWESARQLRAGYGHA